MKYIVFSICLFSFVVLSTGCQKNSVSNDDLEGVWELRSASSMMSITYPPGSGNTLKFTGNNYEVTTNGSVTESGTFNIVEDASAGTSTCMQLTADRYKHRVVFSAEVGNRKTFFEIKDNKLELISGCFAVDAGVLKTYARIGE